VHAGWLSETIGSCKSIHVLEDHSPVGGLGDSILNALVECGLLGTRRFKKFAVEGCLACGSPQEVLKHHGLAGAALASKLKLDITEAMH